MFKLKFKENIRDISKDQINELLKDVIDIEDDKKDEKAEDKIKLKETPLSTDKYLELIELINLNTKNNIVNLQPKSNLFSAKSVITVATFLLTSIIVQLDNALLDNKISYNEGLGISVSLLGAISTVAARGAEGKEGIYTPHYLMGLNKEDYNNESIDRNLS